jgi:transcriptional regulator with XRE-family HTH domain
MTRTPRDDDQLHSSPAFAQALGRTIKVIRTDLGIDRRTLAQEAGISYSYLTEIENGNKPPSSSVLGPIASALRLRMSQLIQAAEDRVGSVELEQERAALQERSALYERSALQKQSALRDAQMPLSSPASQPAPSPEESPPILDRFELQLRAAPPRNYAMRPSFRGPNRNLRAALMELEALLPSLSPEDVERLLDFARRLAR